MFGHVCTKGLNKMSPHLNFEVFTSKIKSYFLSLYSFMYMLYNLPLIIIQNISFGWVLIVERPFKIISLCKRQKSIKEKYKVSITEF